MEEPPVVPDDAHDIEEDEDGDRRDRSKRWLLLALLLLLLLCGVSTAVDVWVIRGPDQARFITRNLECLQCHTELIPEMQKNSVHSPFLLKECRVCHTPHGKVVERTISKGASRTWRRAKTVMSWLPLKWAFWAYDGVAGVSDSSGGGKVVDRQTAQYKDQQSSLTMPEEELCWLCHGNLGPELNMPFPHVPFKKGYCSNCHNPHASDFRSLLVMDVRDLCVTCHPIGEELARDQVHPPAEIRACTNCHDPHASEWKGILVDNQRDLCFTCHPSVAYMSTKAVQHDPYRLDECTSCHEPHGSNYTPLLDKETPTLCYRCHPEVRLDFLKPSHHPVDEVKLECETCHNPHAADYDALLTAADNSFCYGCHGEAIRATYDASRHEKTLCIRCHSPHGTVYKPLLRNSNPDLCLECHEWTESHHNQHPVRPVYYDPFSKKGLTCTSTCHNPHGTAYNFMLRNFSFAKDGQCLQCHVGVSKWF